MFDPSVVDEHDPFAVNPELETYDPRNGFWLPPGEVRPATDASPSKSLVVAA